MSGTANQLVCNGCLASIELGRSFTWVLGKPYHNHCANYTGLITHAEAEKMVQAERDAHKRKLATLKKQVRELTASNQRWKLAAKGASREIGKLQAAAAIRADLRVVIATITDPDFIWEAMDNVHDMDVTMNDYARAVSKAQRAAIEGVAA